METGKQGEEAGLETGKYGQKGDEKQIMMGIRQLEIDKDGNKVETDKDGDKVVRNR